MTMSKDKTRVILLLSAVIAVSVLLFLAAAYFTHAPRKTLGHTDPDDFAGIFVPSSENVGLFFDIKGYVSGSGIYIFLPSSVTGQKLIFYSTNEEGELLERFEEELNGEPFEVAGVPVRVMQSGLPAVELSISPTSPGLSEIEASDDHDLSTRGRATFTDLDGLPATEGMTLRGRGNTSWQEDKKSYQISLARPKDVFGMGLAENWVLLSNAADHSLLRNEVFLSLAEDLGLEFTPKLKEVDLFIDGEYRGVYSLATRVETGKNRVDIGRNDYLYRIGVDKDPYTFLLYDDIEKKDRKEYQPIYGELRDTKDRVRIERSVPFVKTVIEEMYDENSDLTGCDLTSFARYYWLQEFSKTTDPALRSVYMYWKNDDQTMYMGPAWDYDRTAGIIEMPFREEDYLWPDGWTARTQDYYQRMIKNPVFIKAVEEEYKTKGVREAFIRVSEELPQRIENIRAGAAMNFIRWDISGEEESNKVSEVYGDNSFESHVKWLTDWINLRIEWIEEEMG